MTSKAFITGKTITIHVASTETTILEMKHWIEDNEGIPPHQQRLIFAGKELEDDLTIGESSELISSGSTIHLVTRLREWSISNGSGTFGWRPKVADEGADWNDLQFGWESI